MHNMNLRIEGSKLIVEIDITRTDGAVTKGGNTMISTSGNWQVIDGHPDLSFNCVLVKSTKKSR